MRKIFLFFFACIAAYSSEIPDFQDFGNCRGVVFLLSTLRSGTNLVAGCLTAITRKPVSRLDWKLKVFDPFCQKKSHPAYNRPNLPLVSDQPVLYRTHEINELNGVCSDLNKLIFVTRNPKELLYRDFFINCSISKNPDSKFIEQFLDRYLQTLSFYDHWSLQNRFIIFYEDFIFKSDEIIVELLEFIDEESRFLDDFRMNKEQYLTAILTSYSEQRETEHRGKSSLSEGPQAIFYTRNASLETLTYIDEYIQKQAPSLWEKYLKRYKS